MNEVENVWAVEGLSKGSVPCVWSQETWIPALAYHSKE